MHGDLQGSCAGSEKWEKEAQGHRIVVTQRADWQPSLLRSTTSAPVSKSTSRCLFPPSTISSSVKCPLSRFPSSTLALCVMSLRLLRCFSHKPSTKGAAKIARRIALVVTKHSFKFPMTAIY
jgi:hypothetical protein